MGKLGINLPLLIAQLINFGVVAFLLAYFLYRPVLNALENRTKRIQESIENAELVKQQLARAQQDYDAQIARGRQEGAQIVAQANERAKVQADEVIAHARSEAERITAEARQQAQVEREQMLRGLQTQLATLVTQTASTVIGQELRGPDHERLVQHALSQMGRL
ncbi:MAG: F0F1 ATP synthase subunit B [Herpetosiphon sp.]